MKRFLFISILFLPLICSAQVNCFMGRFDVSRVDSINDSTWYLGGKFTDMTGSWTALDADTGQKIIQRGYNTSGRVVFDRYVITGIDYVTATELEVFVKSDYPSGIQNMGKRPLTGSFPISCPVNDTSKLSYRASFYQNNIDPDYDAALDNLNLSEIGLTETEQGRYQGEISSDGENTLAVPFQLKSNTIIIYNGTPLRSTQWNIVTPTTLTVNLDVKRYDHIVLIN